MTTVDKREARACQGATLQRMYGLRKRAFSVAVRSKETEDPEYGRMKLCAREHDIGSTTKRVGIRMQHRDSDSRRSRPYEAREVCDQDQQQWCKTQVSRQQAAGRRRGGRSDAKELYNNKRSGRRLCRSIRRWKKGTIGCLHVKER